MNNSGQNSVLMEY